MELVANGTVFCGGTYNSNISCLAAASATLDELSAPSNNAYKKLHELGNRLIRGLNNIFEKQNVKALAQGPEGYWNIFFTPLEKVLDFRQMLTSDQKMALKLQRELLKRGIFISPTWHNFMSVAHTKEDIDKTLIAVDAAIKAINS